MNPLTYYKSGLHNDELTFLVIDGIHPQLSLPVLATAPTSITDKQIHNNLLQQERLDEPRYSRALVDSEPPPSARRYLTELELTTRWNISVKTLQRWRSMDSKPVFAKFGRTVRYPLHGIGGVLDMEASIASTQSGEHGHE